MIRLALVILVGGLCATAEVSASPDPKDLAIPLPQLAKARELVKRLGSEAYREREDADAELVKMGRLARPAVLEGVLANPNPEVRSRCSRLLPKAEADDLKARIDTFLADTESKFKHDLPGLKQFRERIGTDKAARELFVEIIQNPHSLALLKAVDKTPAEAGRAIADRQLALLRSTKERKPNSRTDVACLIFAESLVPAESIPPLVQGWDWKWSIIWVRDLDLPAPFGADEETERRVEVNHRIVFRWMESRRVKSLDQIPYPFPTGK